MIIELSSNSTPTITDTDRLDRLHATCDVDLDLANLGQTCVPADADHVWVSVDALRDAADDAEGFEAMIAYAGSKGWLNDDATMVRAHIERS